jgi:phage tail sheath protein FI
MFEALTPNSQPFVAADLPLDPHHERAGSPDSVFAYFAARPANLARARTIPIVIDSVATGTGVDILHGFFATDPTESPPSSPPSLSLQQNLEIAASSAEARSAFVTLSDGNDGRRPTADEYMGAENATTGAKSGLIQFEDLEDISIVAAPGSTFGYENGYQTDARAITGLIISHAERMRYRIAVLDSGDGQAISQVRAMRARYDSKYAALYYPWIRVLDPLSQREISVPPSGFVAGIYARNDVNRAVYKAPANEVVNLAIGFEQFLNKGQQETLNPEGINCFRFFEGRGMRLWGARTISSDPEWKYVNLRRYFAYVERSIDKGTQWAVFEPNGEQLWANVRRTIEDFLLNEWQNGALLGDKPEKAYFVKCDRSTMSQNDLDNGRLICLVGLAALKPAEFVIFRIGQWTADRKV